MVDIRIKRCRHEGCAKQPTLAISGSNSPTVCSQQASKSISIEWKETISENVRQTHQNLEEDDDRSSTNVSKEALGMVNGDHVKVELKLQD